MPVCRETHTISSPVFTYQRTICQTTHVYRFKVDVHPGITKKDLEYIIEDITSTIRGHPNVDFIEATP
jgi:hypothetical protein